MMAWFLFGTCVILAVVAGYFLLAHRSKEGQLQEYKALFEEAISLQHGSQARVEELLIEANQKDVLMERGAQSLEVYKAQLEVLDNLKIEREEEISKLESALEFQEGQYEKLFGQKKSSEVRTGKITEQISPFLSDYPLNPATARFLGDPIDFVHFDEDKVTFVEVKSGKSQLSKKQRGIRDLIKDGKVEFIIYRVEGK